MIATLLFDDLNVEQQAFPADVAVADDGNPYVDEPEESDFDGILHDSDPSEYTVEFDDGPEDDDDEPEEEDDVPTDVDPDDDDEGQ